MLKNLWTPGCQLMISTKKKLRFPSSLAANVRCQGPGSTEAQEKNPQAKRKYSITSVKSGPLWKNWYSLSLIFPVSKVKSLIFMSCCGQTSDGTLVPRNLSSYLLSRLFIAFCMLERWLSTHDGKDNKKRKPFYCFAFLSSNFSVVPLSKWYLQSDVLTWYCTFQHYFVKIS